MIFDVAAGPMLLIPLAIFIGATSAIGLIVLAIIFLVKSNKKK